MSIFFQIDFVAHDDLPYGAGNAEDIYKWLKDRGMWVLQSYCSLTTCTTIIISVSQ